MKLKLFSAALFLFSLGISQDIPDEEYGYVEVRPGAHMFWWFYGSTNTKYPRNDVPVVLWLQGGPGAGGSGYGNFGEIGQLDEYLDPREYAWTEQVNLLFIDNPVGAGYSYVDNLSLLTTNVEEIASDLLACHMELVANNLPFLKTLPYWIFSESYGGKMTAQFGNTLYQAIANGDIVMNFQGVMLGDSWISGISYVNTWPDYLRALTLVDDSQYASLQSTAQQCQDAVNAGNWFDATNIWGTMETQIENYTDNVDFYYVLQFDLNLSQSLSVDTYANDRLFVQRKHFLHDIDRYLHKKREYAEADSQTVSSGINETQLNYIMNGPIKQQLSTVVPQSVVWGGQSNAVFAAQEGDFMKPVVNEVDMLLQKGLYVNVWNGQLDLICCTLGTLDWIESLNWGSLPAWQKSAKNAQLNLDQNDVAYFKKSYNNFAMYFMMKAGHMVPADNPVAAFQALSDIINLPL